MRFSAFCLTVVLALAVSACGGAGTPAATATTAGAAPAETPMVATTTPLPTETPSGPTGSISGSILPPPFEQPATAIRIYAREIATSRVFGTEIAIDQTSYTIPGLPMGTYTVFAWYYPDGMPGAYTSAGIDYVKTSSEQMKCGNSVIEIVLSEANPNFQGADIACWAGDYFIYITPMP